MSTEEDNVTHCVKGGVPKVCQEFLSICNTDGESGEKKVRYWLGEHCLVEFNVDDCEHGC